MNERFHHTVTGLGTCSMRVPLQFSSVEEQNRDTLLEKSDDKLQNIGQSNSDTSSLLNTSLASDSSYQSVEDKTSIVNCADHDHEVIKSTRDGKHLARHEDTGSHGDDISCVSGVYKVEDHVERENGLNGATSADKTPLIDMMVDELVDKSNPLLKDKPDKANGSLIYVEGAKDIKMMEGSEKLCAPLEEHCTEATPLPSPLADTKVGSANIEDEVRVCDICGDLGREYMLAICSKCSDGAEHIYCMRAPMDKVPEGDWLCEDCEMKQESEIQNQLKADNSKEILMRSSSIEDVMPKPQSLISSNALKNPMSFERRKPSAVVSPNNNDVSVLRKRSLEGYAELPKGSSPKRRLVKSFVQNGLVKSKSFNVMDSKVKDRFSRQDSLKNLTTTKDVCEKKFLKSKSFNNARIDTSIPDMEKAKKMVIGAAGQTIGAISTNKISAFKAGLSKLDKKNTSYSKMVLLSSKASPRGQESPKSCRLPSSPLARKRLVKTESCPKPNRLDSHERHPIINLPRVLSISSWETVIPRIDRDWRGSFEVSTGGGPCTRIQAHCSIRASDNVLDLVRKLPTKIVLDELPRRSVSPTQFTEDNIATFFFAEDLKSYDNYKNMLKRMMDNDFALKGSCLDGAELLIFSSSILPPSSQRWNNLLFLWGLFRQRPVDVPDSSAACSDPCLSLQLPKTEPGLPKTTLQKNSDEMVRAGEMIKPVLASAKLNHLCHSTSKSPVALKLFSEARQLCSISKVPEPQDLKPLEGYKTRDYDINVEWSKKRMKSCHPIGTPPGGFHFASTPPPLAAMDECEGVDLELSLGTVQKMEVSKTRDAEVAPVSLSLSLSLPFS